MEMQNNRGTRCLLGRGDLSWSPYKGEIPEGLGCAPGCILGSGMLGGHSGSDVQNQEIYLWTVSRHSITQILKGFPLSAQVPSSGMTLPVCLVLLCFAGDSERRSNTSQGGRQLSIVSDGYFLVWFNRQTVFVLRGLVFQVLSRGAVKFRRSKEYPRCPYVQHLYRLLFYKTPFWLSVAC